MYIETEKIARDSGTFITYSLIAKEHQSKSFIHYLEHKQNREYADTRITVKKLWGAGVEVEISKHGKRHQSLSVSLGKSDIEMLIRFLNSIELADYHGEFVPTKLVQIP